MTLTQELMELTKDMNEDMLLEVVNFAKYIITKNNKDQKKLVDEFIKNNRVALKELSK